LNVARSRAAAGRMRLAEALNLRAADIHPCGTKATLRLGVKRNRGADGGPMTRTVYKAGQRAMYGLRLPEGLRDNKCLPAPLLTPTSKEFHGGHDAPLSPMQIISDRLLTVAQWEEMSALSLSLFARGQAIAAHRGLILADTKYEFGTDTDGHIVLADEIHTPDSSRYWRAVSYEARFAAGQRPESFDKDFVRAWVAERCDPYQDDIPLIPNSLILGTSTVYIEAFETITGQFFTLPDPAEDMLTRNAAPSVGAFDEIGSIEPGKQADLTLIDLRNPSLRPLIDPVSSVVHYGHPGIVDSVMVGGEWIMRDRRVLTIDEDTLVDAAQDVTERVWARMLRDNPDIQAPPGSGGNPG
jgi:phosphoribosylaminoimidazole-succinocarboxamide synthase